MSDTASTEKSPKDTFDELRTLVTDYAKQETTGPLQSLGKWVMWGVAGALCVALGTIFIALAVLRFFQDEVDWFQDREQLFTIPYLFAIVVLLAAIGLAGMAAVKSFDDE